MVDSAGCIGKRNSHSKLNCILAGIHALKAGAEEAFVTGSVGGQTPVVEIDGRTIGTGEPGPVTGRICSLYRALIEAECPLAPSGKWLSD